MFTLSLLQLTIRQKGLHDTYPQCIQTQNQFIFIFVFIPPLSIALRLLEENSSQQASPVGQKVWEGVGSGTNLRVPILPREPC